MSMVNKKGWDEFRECGLLWWINTILHMFGWAIVCEVDGGEVKEVYPARVKYRGFSEEQNTNGYAKVIEYLEREIKELAREAKE